MSTAATAADAIEPIVDELTALHHATGRGHADLFRDWIDLLVAVYTRDDDRHADVLAAYEDEQTAAERYSAAMGHFWMATLECQHEVLGEVYMALGARSDALGQHFTPYNVADAKAGMLISADELADTAGREDPYLVGDPACGSGRLLVAVAKRVYHLVEAPDSGVDGDSLPPIYYAGKDKSGICAKMTAVNMVVAGMPGLAIQGDTLGETTHRIWKTRPSHAPPLVDATDREGDPFVLDRGVDVEATDEPADSDRQQASVDGWSS